MPFKALQVTETTPGNFTRKVIERHLDDLPEGDVLIRVKYSVLNYKDALSATGNKGITKKFPHTPGIDAVGIVEISKNENFASGDEVIVTGYDLGMNTCGGFAEYIRVPADWIMNKPDGYSFQDCMTIGTAGFTAAVALHKMELMGQQPELGPVVVTGASGGVGSLAVSLLSKAGYKVIAVTGKKDAHDYLTQLGASEIKDRDFANDVSGKQLLKPRWAAAIDTVGGNTLATLIKGCMLDGCVVSTGLVNSAKLETSVYPFILNGVNLLGVGSAETPMLTRVVIWQKLISDWNIKPNLQLIAKVVTLEELNETWIDAILEGRTTGRIVVKL